MCVVRHRGRLPGALCASLNLSRGESLVCTSPRRVWRIVLMQAEGKGKRPPTTATSYLAGQGPVDRQAHGSAWSKSLSASPFARPCEITNVGLNMGWALGDDEGLRQVGPLGIIQIFMSWDTDVRSPRSTLCAWDSPRSERNANRAAIYLEVEQKG